MMDISSSLQFRQGARAPSASNNFPNKQTWPVVQWASIHVILMFSRAKTVKITLIHHVPTIPYISNDLEHLKSQAVLEPSTANWRFSYNGFIYLLSHILGQGSLTFSVAFVTTILLRTKSRKVVCWEKFEANAYKFWWISRENRVIFPFFVVGSRPKLIIGNCAEYTSSSLHGYFHVSNRQFDPSHRKITGTWRYFHVLFTFLSLVGLRNAQFLQKFSDLRRPYSTQQITFEPSRQVQSKLRRAEPLTYRLKNKSNVPGNFFQGLVRKQEKTPKVVPTARSSFSSLSSSSRRSIYLPHKIDKW